MAKFLPAIFPNLDDNTQPREKIIKDVLEKGKKISLFPEFIDFYEKICKSAESVIFITGRKESEFGELTDTHLSPLKMFKDFRVIYYPEEKSHSSEEYFNWKINTIRDFFNENCADFNKNDIIFKIYDDMPDYFDDIAKIAENEGFNIILMPIKTLEDWKVLIK